MSSENFNATTNDLEDKSYFLNEIFLSPGTSRVQAYPSYARLGDSPLQSQPLLDCDRRIIPSSAGRYPHIHGPTDQRSHHQPKGKQAEGKTSQTEWPNYYRDPRISDLVLFVLEICKTLATTNQQRCCHVAQRGSEFYRLMY